MPFEAIDAERDRTKAETTIVTNLLVPIRLTDALVDHLAAASDSAIVNVTSGLAFVPLPKAPTYSATKAALHSYTQALRVQLEGKVEVIELVPRSEEHTSELQSLMRISYAVFCLKKKNNMNTTRKHKTIQ